MSSEKEDEISVSISTRRSTINFVDTAIAYVFTLCSARLHFIGVTPKIFGVRFKILRRTCVRSTRCWRTEVSDQGKTAKNGIGLWPTQRKFSTSAWGLCRNYAPWMFWLSHLLLDCICLHLWVCLCTSENLHQMDSYH